MFAHCREHQSGYIMKTTCAGGISYLCPGRTVLHRTYSRKIRLIEGNAKCRHLKKGL
jgi:hypothetical protein